MRAKNLFLNALCGTLLSAGSLLAQDLPSAIPYPESATEGATTAPNIDEGHHELSNWITYGCATGNCLGPTGANGPLSYDLYFRTGLTQPVGGEFLGRLLNGGMAFDVGGRALFLNAERTGANVFDLGISNYNNKADISESLQNPLTIDFGNKTFHTVTVRSLNRTFFNLALGRESYLFQSIDAPGRKWSVGFDVGGRYGSAMMRFNEDHTGHLTDVIGGTFTGLYSNLLCPVNHGACILEFGVRTEYSYTWSDIMRRMSDLQDFNVLVTTGIRY